MRRTQAARLFDARFYLDRYPDVRRGGIDPLRHFVEHGWRECRNPNAWFSTANYLQQHPQAAGSGLDPLTHLVRSAGSRGLTKARARATPSTSASGSLLPTLVRLQPQFPMKWDSELYLARGLCSLDRARSQFHTFAIFQAFLPAPEFQTLLERGRTLWRSHVPAGPVEITLSLAERVLNEGEFALTFRLFHQPLAVLSFNIMPGDPLQRSGDRLLIARMQAMPDQLVHGRIVGKALGEVTPQAALFAAAQGLGQALGLTGFMGVSAAQQVSLAPQAVARCTGAYDAFYESLGATRDPSGFYIGPLTPDEKPLSSVKAGHKIRTRRKRALKATIRDAARQALTTPDALADAVEALAA